MTWYWYVDSLAADPVRHRGTVARGQVDTACGIRFCAARAVRGAGSGLATGVFGACPDCPAPAVTGTVAVPPGILEPARWRRALRRAWVAGRVSGLVPDPVGLAVLAGAVSLVLVFGYLALGTPR